MAKPRLQLHVHGEDPFGATLEAARAGSSDPRIRAAAPFPAPAGGRVLGAVLKLAHAVGGGVLLSLSNERLLRAWADPAERKALSDGASRRTLLPVPAPAHGVELRALAPFEGADELRLNVDLWRRALITPPFAAPPEAPARRVLYVAEPAVVLRSTARFGGKDAVLGIDLASVERGSDPEGALARLANELRARTDVRLVAAVTEGPGYADDLLTRTLVAGRRYPSFAPDDGEAFDGMRDGYPVELARRLAAEPATPRALAPFGVPFMEASFDPWRLEPAAARGLLLRRLARGGGPDDVPAVERARASFLLAAVLIDRVAEDGAAVAAIPVADALPRAREVLERLDRHVARAAEEAGDHDGARAAVAEARSRHEALAAAVPSRAGEPAAFLGEVRALTIGGLDVLEALCKVPHAIAG